MQIISQSPVTGFLLLVAGLLTIPVAAPGQSAPERTRSTRDSVYTVVQAARGSEIYALSCANCHTAVSHTGAAFVAKWDGHLLFELFDYIHEAMPKQDPGSLTVREYTLLLAYLLKLNGMPAGAAELPGDSLALKQIRIDLKATRDSSQR